MRSAGRSRGSPAGDRRRLPVVVLLQAVCLMLAGCGTSFNGTAQTELALAEAPQGGAGLTSPTGSANARHAVPLPRAADAFASANTPGSSAYKVGPQDVLDISVFKVPELSRSVQVADSGSVNLPLVGEVPAAGKTAQELERDLAAKLGAKYLQSPQVTVFVKEFNSQRVTVEGAVKKPGVYPLRGKNSLLQVIATAEGLDPAADLEVVVFRQADGRRSAAKFDVDEIRAGRAEDPIVQQGDVIVVNASTIKGVFNNLMKILPAGGAFVALL